MHKQKKSLPLTKFIGLKLLFFAAIFFVFYPFYQFYFINKIELKSPLFKIQKKYTNHESTPHYSVKFSSNGITPHVHSAAAIELNNNNIRAFWYGGKREGSKDSQIFTSLYNIDSQQWKAEQPIISRAKTKKALRRYISKIGNPTIIRDNDKLLLFYVSVSVGGWAGSAINVTTSLDEGKTWGPIKRLINTPFLNLSTLVKNAAFHYQDGTIGLPVYQQFMGKFSEIIQLDNDINIINKTRLSKQRYALQPVILPTSEHTAVALMRYAKEDFPRRILQSSTSDTGQTWTAPKKNQLANPNSGLTGLRLDNGDLILVFNNSDDGRHILSLAHSSDNGNSWQILHDFERTDREIVSDPTTEKGYRKNEFSYPWLLQTSNGGIHLFYTWQQTHIKHIQFNKAWLEQQIP